jgi:hypothetical protein
MCWLQTISSSAHCVRLNSGNSVISEVSIPRSPALTDTAPLKYFPAALLSTLVASTSSLDSLPAESSSSEKARVEHFKVADVVSAYKLLLFFPIEYFTKSCRADLVKRAVIADWRLSKRFGGSNENEELLVGLSVVRTFLKRTFGFLGVVEQQTVRSTHLRLTSRVLKYCPPASRCRRFHSSPPRRGVLH